MKPRDEFKARDILTATIREIEAVGLAGLSMEAVARRAEVATGTVYIYFKNKDALISVLYASIKDECADLLVTNEGLPVRVAFSRMCIALLEFVVANPGKVVFMAQVAHSPYLLPAGAKNGADLGSKWMTALLERGKQELLLKDLETSFMLGFVLAVLRDLGPRLSSLPAAERAARFELVAALCWDALKA